MGEAGVHGEGHVGGGLHLADGGVEDVGHALAAVFGITVEAGPAALAQEVEGLTETGGGADDAVFEDAALAVADGVERSKHVAGDLAGLLEDCGGEVAVEVGVAGDVGVLHLQHVVQDEIHVAERRGVAGHGGVSPGLLGGAGDAVPGEVSFGPLHLFSEVGNGEVELGALGFHRFQALHAKVIDA